MLESEPTTLGRHARRIEDALHGAIHDPATDLQRLEYAEASVTFRTAGEGDAVTLHLDRDPCHVTRNGGGDIEITLEPSAVERFARGHLTMLAALLDGEAHATGPAQRYLEVDTVLRHALAAQAGADPDRVGEDTPALTRRDIDTDLLAIETRELHKSFGNNHILRGLNIRIPVGMISVVLGPSGTGKSVLLQHVIGIMHPDRGETLVHGQPLSGLSRSELLDLRCDIGVMFQDGALFSGMTVYDNVAFPLQQHTTLTDTEIDEIVREHLANVGLTAAARHMPSSLSGGMRKRAGLARAMALEPRILLCDEPDSGLDPVRTALLGELLKDQHAKYGGTIVVVTHNILLAKLIAQHIAVVWRGEVLESGLAPAVLASGTPFVQQFLAGASHGPLGMDA